MPLFAASIDELEAKALDFARGVGPEPADELPWGIQAIDDSADRKAAKEAFLKSRKSQGDEGSPERISPAAA
jgi:hypothetical protein